MSRQHARAPQPRGLHAQRPAWLRVQGAPRHKCYGVSFELGAGTLSLAARMTAAQARAMARALSAAADAADATQQQEGGAA